MQLFVDMDGVLADFDAHYEAVFGVRASKELDNIDWDRALDHGALFCAARVLTGRTLASPSGVGLGRRRERE
jgi:hypothetical protein